MGGHTSGRQKDALARPPAASPVGDLGADPPVPGEPSDAGSQANPQPAASRGACGRPTGEPLLSG